MSRITDRDLDNLALIMNKLTSSPSEYIEELKDGRTKIQVGHFHVSKAYGGVSLHRTMNESGGVTDVFNCGHISKRELYIRMDAYIDGLIEGARK